MQCFGARSRVLEFYAYMRTTRCPCMLAFLRSYRSRYRPRPRRHARGVRGSMRNRTVGFGTRAWPTSRLYQGTSHNTRTTSGSSDRVKHDAPCTDASATKCWRRSRFRMMNRRRSPTPPVLCGVSQRYGQDDLARSMSTNKMWSERALWIARHPRASELTSVTSVTSQRHMRGLALPRLAHLPSTDCANVSPHRQKSEPTSAPQLRVYACSEATSVTTAWSTRRCVDAQM